MERIERGKAPTENTAVFARAKAEDIPGIVTLVHRLAALPPELERNLEWMQRARQQSERLLAEWMQVEPRGHYIVRRKRDGGVVALCWMLPMKSASLVAYLRGDLGHEVSSEDLEPFQPGQPATCILKGISSDPTGGRRLQAYYASLLFRGWRVDLEQLGREGVNIAALYAFTRTDAGKQLGVKRKWQEWEPAADGKHPTFWLDVAASDAFVFERYKLGYAQWQRDQKGAAEGQDHMPT